MATTQEMLQAGIARELKIHALSEIGQLVVALDAQAHSENDDALVAGCHAFMECLNGRMETLGRENVQAFQAFQAALGEVDALERMLQDGGEEIPDA